MNIVTGVSGLLGMHIARALAEKGEQVVGIIRPNSDMSIVNEVFTFYNQQHLLDRISFQKGDVLDTDSLLQLFQEDSIVYHCAAVVSYHSADRKLMYQTNVEGTANVVNAAIEKKVKRIIQISSIAALKRTFESEVTENGEWEDNSLNTHYGITKHLSEMEIWRGIQEGVDGVILNPGLIIGPSDFNRSSSSIFSKLSEGFDFYPPGGTGFVGVKDVANLAVVLSSKGRSGQRYIAVSDNWSMKELFQKIAKAIDAQVPTKEAKPWMLHLARIAEWLKEKFSGKKALVTIETVKNASIRFEYSNEKVKKELDYSFASLNDAISETAGFFKLQRTK